MEEIQYIPAKTIITRTKGAGWFGTEYNMNIYRGCSHGCIYCDSRSDCYQNAEFDKVKAKKDALSILRKDLQRKVKPGVIGTGAMSDPYNPQEAKLLFTRHGLELISAYNFGVAIATKSPLVCRDMDILKEIQEHSPVLVKMTITSAEDDLCRKIEPYVAPSSQRFAAIRKLSEAGIFTGVLLMPVLPFLEDTPENIRAIVQQAEKAGARFVYPAFGVTMRDGQREYFLNHLDQQFPGLAARYINQYGTRYTCGSPRAKVLWDIFREECGRVGMLYKMPDIIAGYKMGYQSSQLSWF